MLLGTGVLRSPLLRAVVKATFLLFKHTQHALMSWPFPDVSGLLYLLFLFRLCSVSGLACGSTA